MKKIAFTLMLILLCCTALTVVAGSDTIGLDGWDMSASAETGSSNGFTLTALVGQTVADGGEHTSGSSFSLTNGFLNSDSATVPTAILSSGMQAASGNGPTLIALLLVCTSGLLWLTGRLTQRRR